MNLRKILLGICISAIAVITNYTTLSAAEVVVYDPISASVKRGVFPIKINSNDATLLTFLNKIFSSHGAFEIQQGKNAAINIFVTKTNGGLKGTIDNLNKNFFVVGETPSSIYKLVDDMIVALGKHRNIDIKPIFSASKLGFSSERTGKREIYFSDLFFRDIRQATNHKSLSIAPHWHPNGKRMYYTTYFKSGAADVYSIDITNGALKKIAAYKNTNTGGAVSPNGQQVALVLSAHGPMNIYVAPSDGGKAKAIVSNNDVKVSPEWSPDGKQIVFASGPTGSPRLYVVNSTGGKTSRLPTGYSYATEPSWNPVFPELIAFSYNAAGRSAIAIYNLKTGKTKDLGFLTGGRKYFNPSWCADGRHLVVVEEIGKTTYLALVDAGDEKSAKFTRISTMSMKNCYDPDVHISK